MPSTRDSEPPTNWSTVCQAAQQEAEQIGIVGGYRPSAKVEKEKDWWNFPGFKEWFDAHGKKDSLMVRVYAERDYSFPGLDLRLLGENMAGVAEAHGLQIPPAFFGESKVPGHNAPSTIWYLLVQPR